MSLSAKIQKHIEAANGEPVGPYFIEDIDIDDLEGHLADFRENFVFPDFTPVPPVLTPVDFVNRPNGGLAPLGYFRGVPIFSAIDSTPVLIVPLVAEVEPITVKPLVRRKDKSHE